MVKKSEIREAIHDPKKAFRVANYRLDVSFGKLLFKNTAPFTQNVSGAITKVKMQKQNKGYLKGRSKNPLAEEFRDKGHVSLGCIYEKSLIETLSSKFNSMIEDDRFSSIRAERDGQVFSRGILLVAKHMPEISKLMTKEVIDIYEQYYGGPFEILDVYAWRNYHVPDSILEKYRGVYSDDWHCDGHNTTWTKLMIYLTDVTDQDGPFNIQSSERTKELIEKGFGSRTNPKLPKEVLEDPKYSTRYMGPKGSVVSCNTTVCLHRATIPAQGRFRDIIQFQIGPSNTPLPNNWPEHLKLNKEYQTSLKQNNVKDLSIT